MTLGLSQITNDAEATITFLEAYGQYFDSWFITVADKKRVAYTSLEAWGKDNPKLKLSWYSWNDDFAAARNKNLETIDTDYWLWADSDDTIEHPERLRGLAQYMQANKVDVIQLKYDYAQNEAGQAVANHWRERLISNQLDTSWQSPVHEVLHIAGANIEKSDFVVVKHHKDKASVRASADRNEQILLKHFAKTKDPRDAQYLGMTYLGKNDPDKAIAYFLEHIKTSGWDEDKYRSWCRIAEAEYLRDNYEQALYATDEATKLHPDFPDAYYIKVLVYGSIEQFDKAIEWLKVAMSKPEPNTLAIVDPTLYKYRGIAMGAQCYLFSGQIKEAYRLYQYCMKQSDEAFTPEFQKLFKDAYYDQKAIDYTRYLLYYLGGNGGKPAKLIESLPPRIHADPRLNAERVKFLPKQVWPKKSIAIFCGNGVEAWGPDTISKGLGGSEEAVVYLSRELRDLGWSVTVFNDREEEYNDNGVIYKPWPLLNPYDTFDCFVAWRQPELLRGIKARKKITDLHDTIPAERIYAMARQEPDIHYMVKSQWHRNLYPKLDDSYFTVVGNGISKEHFND